MNIKKLEQNWEKFGQRDPLWSILAVSGKENSNFWKKKEFFKTGESEIKKLVKQIKLYKKDQIFNKALDFGCGVGRLTQALAKYFNEVYGIDIASSMIKLAQKYNTNKGKCKYFVNKTNDLLLFQSNFFDFIYSHITLQHMENRYTKNYLKEFIRIIKPNGLLIFQCPSKEIHKPFFIKILWYKFKRMILNRPIMEMYPFERRKLSHFLKKNHVKIIAIIKDFDCGPEWLSYHYYVTK